MASRLEIENPGSGSAASPNLSKSLFLAVVFLAVSIVHSAGQTRPPKTPAEEEFSRKLSAAAIERTHHAVRYDPAYVRIPYPGGDVPSGTGVCTDEVIRAYRTLGIDLQKEVHEDMLKDFDAYPDKSIWSLAHPDTNIDHRRVPNLI